MAYWLMKSEPDVFGWDDLVKDGTGEWDGVRNHTAARNLRDIKVGDRAFFYHSNIGLQVVGIMEVTREAQKDGDEGNWVSVQVKPVEPLPNPVTLKAVKAEPRLAEMELVKYSRLSVGKVTAEEWKIVLEMAKG
ncbi:EVE domain-containing protein [Sphingomonas qomolangmaensis]|uniref:EVE domain-containing protein n=1 Tax=Sphingomonas qomolangmaensis TaxID=2918765 RepID=A0ABY5L7N4_9SPHN|nr:EVE domain-containing protein [Sphingomonas qomolangmaensis]UUL81750.1 EVE domain-containing protein [Sphingomonas qomolangmaensis]